MVRVSFGRNVTRTFNGKRFSVSIAYSTKREAEAKKGRLQASGYNARVIEINGKYVVFKRKAKRGGYFSYRRR